MTLFLSSRSKILPTDAMKCPWRPRVSIARRRSHSTAWSSWRSPLGWSCGGSWTDGCCECLASVPPTPIWVGGSGSWRALSLTLLWSTLLLWPPCCSWPPGALVLTVPCTQAFKGPFSKAPHSHCPPQGGPLGVIFPGGHLATAGDIVTTKAGKQGFHPVPHGTRTAQNTEGLAQTSAVPRLRNPVQSKGAAPLQAIPPTLLYYLFV